MPIFDWDEGNRKKCASCVPIEEIEAVLSDPETIVTPQFALSLGVDPDMEEQRYRAAGRNHEGRGVFVVFTIQIAGEDLALESGFRSNQFASSLRGEAEAIQGPPPPPYDHWIASSLRSSQ